MILKNKALSLVSRKEYTRHGLRSKLQQYSQDNELIDGLLDHFESSGYVSDMRYVDMYLSARCGKYGIKRLINELKAKGITIEVINQQMELQNYQQNYQQQVEIAYQVVIKKYGAIDDCVELVKLQRFLQYRGFTSSVIIAVIKLINTSISQRNQNHSGNYLLDGSELMLARTR